MSNIDQEMNEYLHHEETIFIDEFSHHSVKAMIHEMESPRINKGIFLHHNVEDVLNAFKKKLTLVMAAGSIVHTLNNELLLIFRHGKWDLPKGKLDPGEDLEECAIRETKEETGITFVEVESPLYPTWHTYHQDGKHVIKETHWFLMKSGQKSKFYPQSEEGIEKCEWVSIDHLTPYLDNTYSLIAELIGEARTRLQIQSKQNT